MRRRAAFFVISAFLFFGLLLFLTNQIRVLEAECISQFGACNPELSKVVERYKDESYFYSKRALSSELSNSTRVDYYHIKFSFPGKMIAELIEKKPEVALKFGDKNFYTFDKEANVVAVVEETQLPVATVTFLPSDKSTRFAALLFSDLFKYYQVHEATVTEFGLTVEIRGAEITFPLSGDIDVLLGSMEVALLQLPKLSENSTIIKEAGKIYTIDLRYKNPVIASR